MSFIIRSLSYFIRLEKKEKRKVIIIRILPCFSSGETVFDIETKKTTR